MHKAKTKITINSPKNKDLDSPVIHLSCLYNNLQATHVNLDPNFLEGLLKNASKDENYPTNRIFVSKIGCGYNKNKKRCLTFYSWLRQNKAMSFLTLFKIIKLSDYPLDSAEKHIVTIGYSGRGGKVPINLPIGISKELGVIVGHILGDGSIGKKDKAVFYSNSNVELLQEFRYCMNLVFGIEPRIWVQEKANFGKTKWMKRLPDLKNVPKGHNVGLFYPKICGTILQAIFGKFADGKEKFITSQIKSSNRQFKIGLLRSFFDDEGSVRSESYSARYHQDRRDILEDIRNLLKEIGITTNDVRVYLKQNKERYYFNITGFKYYYAFYKLIGCTSSKKAEQFELLINKVKNSKYFRKKYDDYLDLVTPTLGQ